MVYFTEGSSLGKQNGLFPRRQFPGKAKWLFSQRTVPWESKMAVSKEDSSTEKQNGCFERRQSHGRATHTKIMNKRSVDVTLISKPCQIEAVDRAIMGII